MVFENFVSMGINKIFLQWVLQEMWYNTFLALSVSSSDDVSSLPWAQAILAPCTIFPTWTADGVTSVKKNHYFIRLAVFQLYCGIQIMSISLLIFLIIQIYFN